MPLETELKYYESAKDELLRHYEGKYVLIIGQEQLGIYDNMEEAYRQGIELRGNVPMLIQKIEEVESIEAIPSMLLGVLNAHL